MINELRANDGGLGAADFDFYFGNLGDKPFTGDPTSDRFADVPRCFGQVQEQEARVGERALSSGRRTLIVIGPNNIEDPGK